MLFICRRNVFLPFSMEIVNLPITEFSWYVLPLCTYSLSNTLLPISMCCQTQFIQIMKANPEASQKTLRDIPGCTKTPQTPPASPHTGQETVTHTHCSSHSCPLTHSLPLVLYKSSFKIATRKIQLSPNSMVCGLCLVWSLNVISWGSRHGLPSQSCRVRAGLVSMSRERLYLHVLLIYTIFWVEVLDTTVHKGDEMGRYIETIKMHS
jgi:hypothetical protein